MSSPIHPRHLISPTLRGDVLEIGPGFRPFPVHENARVRYADRKVGGRDATWPELAGIPPGPNPHFNVNIDEDGLRPIEDHSFDVVISCHMLEHVANPLRALEEMQRVLRPGGKLVLVLPDKEHTFDAKRSSTTFQHLWKEYEDDVKEVSEEHIRNFCLAIWNHPPIHPSTVREWHNPHALTTERLELHRKRSIHVHVWTPQEATIMLVGATQQGILNFTLDDFYTVDQIPEGDSMRNECGFVLLREEDIPGVRCDESQTAARFFVRSWIDIQMGHLDNVPPVLKTQAELRVDAFLGGLYRELRISP